MKATGIVRRIDDLGRVVVPKEIRRVLRIREGDPLLTMLTECGKGYGMGVCGEIKRELFVSGVVGLSERVGK